MKLGKQIEPITFYNTITVASGETKSYAPQISTGKIPKNLLVFSNQDIQVNINNPNRNTMQDNQLFNIFAGKGFEFTSPVHFLTFTNNDDRTATIIISGAV